ncbi:MAG: LysM peptidoglycan-binding domain-containing protein [Phycisphaerae bacterium]|nr:LysM peptidoglycan-binding domain-containing protein [Phycisphaerae bacterium]MCZ2401524.1 LysM peptidoglycan-binding domain-containing protein [Phycisphaerae bacterium]
MVLNMKLAMLLSLGFIGVMCWLVNQVARPGAESPAPGSLVMQASGPIATPVADLNRPRAPELAARFEQSSAAAPERIDRAPRHAPETGGDRLALGGSLAPRPAEIESAPQQAPQTAVAPDPTGRRPPTFAADAGTASRGGGRDVRTPPLPSARPAEAVLSGSEDTPLTVTGPAEPDARAPAGPGSPASEPRRAAVQYKVARNDNLHKVARRIWGSAAPQDVRLLMDANPAVKKRDGRLLIGETIVIPARGGVALASAESPAPRTTGRESPDRAAGRADERPRGAPAPAGRAMTTPTSPPKTALTNAATAKNAPKATGKAAAERPAPRSYRVRKGDSLARIAERELNDRERWREISKLNRLANADHLLPGTTLKLPPPTRDG